MAVSKRSLLRFFRFTLCTIQSTTFAPAALIPACNTWRRASGATCRRPDRERFADRDWVISLPAIYLPLSQNVHDFSVECQQPPGASFAMCSPSNTKCVRQLQEYK